MILLRRLLLVVALLFMLWMLATQWTQLAAQEWSFRPALLGVSLAAIVAIYFLDAYGWHLILVVLGGTVTAERSVRVWLLSSLARYIPGTIWSYTSRVLLAQGEGVKPHVAGMSLYLETLLLLASSLAVGMPALAGATGLSLTPATTLLVWIVLSLLLHPRALALLRHLPGRAGRAVAAIPLPTARAMLGLYMFYLFFWVLFGAVFVCFVSAFFDLPADRWLVAGASLAMGFFLGFIAIIFPGGVGVRESALYALLLPVLPAPVSLAIAAGSRLWTMFGEAVSLGAIVLVEHRARGGRPGA